MTRYAVLAAIALVVRAGTGGAPAILYTSAAVLLAGVILDDGYRVAAKRGTREIPRFRARLDLWVRAQWIGVGLTGLVSGVLFGPLHLRGVDLGSGSGGTFFNAAITAATAAIVAILISSLIDWFWILPRISGIVRSAPCEEPGGQRWARVTGVWLFHRGVATTIVVGALSGVFVYMGEKDPASMRGNWFIVAGVSAAATFAFLNAAGRALWLALNPKLHVGDTLDIHGRPCHIIDVSLQGAKYMILRDGQGAREGFAKKSDGSIGLEDFGRFDAVEGAALAPCSRECTKINWYCRRNETAYD